MEKIRTKGIPHESGPFPFKEEISLPWTDTVQNLVFRLLRWIQDPEHFEIPSDFIQKRFYMFKLKETGEIYFAQHINFKHIQLMMKGEGEMTCFFGTMDKGIIISLYRVEVLNHLLKQYSYDAYL